MEKIFECKTPASHCDIWILVDLKKKMQDHHQHEFYQSDMSGHVAFQRTCRLLIKPKIFLKKWHGGTQGSDGASQLQGLYFHPFTLGLAALYFHAMYTISPTFSSFLQPPKSMLWLDQQPWIAPSCE